MQPGREVIPGEQLVDVSDPGRVHLGAQALDRQRLLEAAEVEVLGPLLEGPPGPPHRLEHPAEPPIARGDDALGRRRRRLVPLDLQPADAPCLALGGGRPCASSSGQLSWACHWKGVWGLGTKPPTEAVTVTAWW